MKKNYSHLAIVLISTFCVSAYAQNETPVKLKRLPESTTTTTLLEVKSATEGVVSPKVDETKPVPAAVVSPKPAPVVAAPSKEESNSDEDLEMENSELRKQIALLLKEKEAKEPKRSTAPSSKFDLISWSLSVPTDLDGNKRADQIKEKELSAGYSSEYFYLAEDGGMVFKSPIGGFKTSTNTSYTRSELREMLRAGNTKIKTKGPTKNNWVFESSNSIYNAGGYDGQLKATLKVDRVTSTGDKKQVGRVIIGQIHAEHNEPLRLYYRKLPNNVNGSIYFAHEGRDNNQEDYYELLGKKSSNAENPEKGIPLGEKFSYQVLVIGNILTVKIIKADRSVFEESVDMAKSGYGAKEEYMYFKAGVYNQNKTGDDDDYAQATFYELSNKHKQYKEQVYDD